MCDRGHSAGGAHPPRRPAQGASPEIRHPEVWVPSLSSARLRHVIFMTASTSWFDLYCGHGLLSRCELNQRDSHIHVITGWRASSLGAWLKAASVSAGDHLF